jgi:hypothetical protein
VLLTVVADYGVGDLAFAEVRQRLALLLPEAEVTAIPVPPFDTVSAGFCLAQLAFGEGPSDRVLYANVAPRQDEDRPREDNAGERLVAARLPSGVLVVGVAAGASMSFLAEAGVPLAAVDVADAGSQFRSRDVFPDALAALVRGEVDLLDDPPARAGTPVRVGIGGVVHEVVVSDGVFAVPAGAIAFAPGSSGWPHGDDVGIRVNYEIFARGRNAAELFGAPPAGTPVELVG